MLTLTMVTLAGVDSSGALMAFLLVGLLGVVNTDEGWAAEGCDFFVTLVGWLVDTLVGVLLNDILLRTDDGF